MQLLEGYSSPIFLFLRNQLRGVTLFVVLLFLKDRAHLRYGETQLPEGYYRLVPSRANLSAGPMTCSCSAVSKAGVSA